MRIGFPFWASAIKPHEELREFPRFSEPTVDKLLFDLVGVLSTTAARRGKSTKRYFIFCRAVSGIGERKRPAFE
ncbi:hypothetical protein I7I53_03476 [Histoplasma capsulatum var. duboisii H88]|uniref:Uncharacterized protein n=1 Tax=Ajellomyces capsulatus (strain H88) TaxID=544711 RepID=A0A8A1LSL7_AJEC8|nr:hypothetical protein I7I53_03476 [Histoplasma capsulatum var. duboisii H88]